MKEKTSPEQTSKTLRDELMDMCNTHQSFGFSQVSNEMRSIIRENDKPDFLIRRENIIKNKKIYHPEL